MHTCGPSCDDMDAVLGTEKHIQTSVWVALEHDFENTIAQVALTRERALRWAVDHLREEWPAYAESRARDGDTSPDLDGDPEAVLACWYGEAKEELEDGELFFGDGELLLHIKRYDALV